MKILLQRVSSAAVHIDGKEHAAIGPGFLLLVGCCKTDTGEDADRLAVRTAALRVFEDEQGRMNKSVADIGGSLLCISQFTLYADTRKGNRPSFVFSGDPRKANILYERFCANLRSLLGPEKIRMGIFGADMKVSLVNDGPCTIELCSETATAPTASPRPRLPLPQLSFQPVVSPEECRLAYDIAAQVWPLCYGDILSAEQIDYMLPRMYGEDVIRRETAAGTPFFLILADGVPAGVCSCDAAPDPGTGELELHKIYLLPQYWGRHIGALTLGEITRRAKAAGAKTLWLRVNKQNARAQKAYISAHFHKASSICTDIGNGFVMDDFIFKKEIL